jgi:transcriptional regulator with XRE-family HTH domain
MPNSKNQRGEASGLAAILRDAARRSGLSVYQIAKESGVDQSTLNKFLNGDRGNLRLDVADRLFKYLGLRVVSQPRGKRK